VQRSYASHTPARTRLANKIAGFRPADAFSVEELLLLQEVMPADFAKQFAAFLQQLRDSPRMLTRDAINNITQEYPILRVCAVQMSPQLPAASSDAHTWQMRYVSMPKISGSSTEVMSCFVIDTGAIVNCMSVEYYAAYKPLLDAVNARSVQPVLDPSSIVSVESSPLSIQTIVLDVPFTIGGRKYVSPFLLVDGLIHTPFLLGGPWILTAQCDILYTCRTLRLAATDKHKQCDIPFVLCDEKITRVGALLTTP
jgi:hypothetical protein